MKSRAVLGFVTAFLVLSGVRLVADTANIDYDIATLYTEAAATALAEGDMARAAELAALALEHNPASSDALHAAATAYRGNQEMTRPAISFAEAAIEADSWDIFDRTEGMIFLATLYIQVGEYQRARGITQAALGSSLSPSVPERWLASIEWLDATALYALGGIDEANRNVQEARGRFPNDTRFFLLELQQEPFPSYRYRAELERLHRENGDEDEHFLASLLLYAESSATQEEKRWGLENYLVHGGSDPSISLVALRLDGWNAGVKLFEELDGYRRADVMRDLIAAIPADAAPPAGALAYDGMSTIDTNGDSFAEETLFLSQGRTVRWQVDADQDGVPEYDAHFTNGEPDSVAVNVGDQRVTIEYDVYPYIQSVRVHSDDGDEIIAPRSRTALFRVAESIPTAGAEFTTPINLPARPPQLDLDAYYRTAGQVDVTSSDGMVVDRSFFERGRLVRSMHDSDEDGRWDRLVLYADDLPTAALRDIDGDGYYEVAETYLEGRLVAVIVDDNDNGSPDLYERRDQGGTREWDLNEDGVIDVYEFGILVNQVRRSFPFAEDQS